MAQSLEEVSTWIWARAEDPGITVDTFRREWLA